MLSNFGAGGTTWRLGTFRGHEISVSPLFLALIGLFVFIGLRGPENFFHQLMWAPVLFFSVVLHELGHAAASKHYGFGTSKIVLHGLGGVAISRGGNRTPTQGIVVALAGPAVTLAIAVVALGLYLTYLGPLGGSTATVLGFLLWLTMAANFFWFVFNILPIFPMDGGQAVMNWLRRKKSQQAALETSLKVSMGALVAAGLVTLVLFQGGGIFILMILGFLGYQNWQIMEQVRKGVPVRFS